MDGTQEQDLDLFQNYVSDRFSNLLQDSPPLMSISWLLKLVDLFLCCEAQFKTLLITGRDPSLFSKPPLDRSIPDLLDRALKSLDICNAVSSGLDSVRQYKKFADIAVSAFQQRPVGDGPVKRAKKALTSLLAAMAVDDKEYGHGQALYKSADRTWSFGRRGNSSNKEKVVVGNFRSLSMVVAKNWSASRQIQAMSSYLVAPRGGEPTGLALPVYVMSCVIVFVMWVLVAAVPCQERSGLGSHFQIPRQFGWAQGMFGLQEKIVEEWKKKEKKGSVGLMEEVQRMERLAQNLVEFADGFQFPGEERKVEEAAAQVAELAEICRRMEEGLVSLQVRVREVFHSIVRSRNEIIQVVEHAAKVSQPIV